MLMPRWSTNDISVFVISSFLLHVSICLEQKLSTVYCIIFQLITLSLSVLLNSCLFAIKKMHGLKQFMRVTERHFLSWDIMHYSNIKSKAKAGHISICILYCVDAVTHITPKMRIRNVPLPGVHLAKSMFRTSLSSHTKAASIFQVLSLRLRVSVFPSRC